MKVKLKSYKKEFIEANRSTAYEFIKPKEMKAKEKAKKLVDRFKSGHVIFSANSKGNFQSPYTSGFMWGRQKTWVGIATAFIMVKCIIIGKK